MWWVMGCWVTEADLVRAGIAADMVEIEDGAFDMGSDDGQDDQQPVHEVTITRDFAIGRAEVTQAQWETVMGEWGFEHLGCADCPAQTLSWNEAAKFVNAMSAAEGLDPCFTQYAEGSTEYVPVPDILECEGYRLPTEAEWEYAARAGSDGDLDLAPGDVGWTAHNTDMTHPGCEFFPSNAWDLCDMEGNVWEWVIDWYGDEYYAESPSTDPKGPTSGSTRIFRGGGWNTDTTFYDLLTFRGSELTDHRSANIGLRIARTLP